MADLERVEQQLVTAKPTEEKIILDAIRERLQSDPNVYFAGELFDPEDDGERFDEHDFFVAPQIPHFNPRELTAFAKRVLVGFKHDLSSARMHQNGDMQLPDALIDQVIGEREVKVTTTTRIRLGSFKGQPVGSAEETEIEKPRQLIQRTKVKIFTDPLSAQTVFEYCGALMRKELDEERSTNIFAIYATHVMPAEHLADLKRHYQHPRNNLPQLPEAK